VGRNPVVVAEPVSDARRVFLVGQQVIGAPDERLVPAVQRLGRLAGAALLECHFARRQGDPGDWVLCGASAFPLDLPAVVVSAIAEALGRAAEEAA
jgi:hypothetical protein